MALIAQGKTSRIVSVDILRGVALMGVLLVNGAALNGPAYMDSNAFAFQNTKADIWYCKFIYLFINNNFYPIFACLFGLTAAMVMSGQPLDRAKKYLTRRMVALLVIGLCHALFIWWGDILVAYALLGLFLPALYQKSSNEIIVYFFAMTIVALFLSFSFYHLNNYPAYPAVAEALSAYSQGDFFTITQQRIEDFLGSYVPGYLYPLDLFQIVDFLMFYAQLFMCLLFGFWVFISGWIFRLTNDVKLARRTALIAFTITFVIAIIAESFPRIGDALFVVKGFSRGIFYASTLLFICHNQLCRRLLYPFSFVGRMSLTNYIVQNFLLSLIFYGYGLGLFGQIGPFAEAPILLGLMLFSVLFSVIWLYYFSFGPLEWLWRKVTQGGYSVAKEQCARE